MIKNTLLFAHGFRPFFLLAGVNAVFVIGVWITLYFGWLEIDLSLPGPWWHAHEMIFGFAGTAAIGFLLTATPNLTGTTPTRGHYLAFMVLMWSVGRLFGFSSTPWAAWVSAGADFLLFSLFVFRVATPMWQTGTSVHRLPPILILTLLVLSDAMVHANVLNVLDTDIQTGLYLGMDTILLLGVIIGGRLMPKFTQGIFQSQGISIQIQSRPWLEAATLLSMVAIVLSDMINLHHPANGLACIITACFYSIRFFGWHPFHRTVPPLLRVLQWGYIWLIVGLTIRGLAQLTHFIPVSTAIHAITIGAMGSLTLGIMTRVVLNHTGRPPKPPKTVVVGFVLISISALVRVAVAPYYPDWSILISGTLWLTSFILFVLFCWPAVTHPQSN